MGISTGFWLFKMLLSWDIVIAIFCVVNANKFFLPDLFFIEKKASAAFITNYVTIEVEKSVDFVAV